jgi:hypothetical protein
MTDQFTPEYKAFVCSDEAKGLQKEWEPKVGDWCWNLSHGQKQVDAEYYQLNKLYLVTDYDLGNRDDEYEENWGSQWVLHAPTEQGPTWIDKTITDQREITDNFVWLPTLWQLLQIIEGAGWEWHRTAADLEMNANNQIVVKEFALLAMRTGADGTVMREVETGGDTMLAAARLAVRAIGGEK